MLTSPPQFRAKPPNEVMMRSYLLLVLILGLSGCFKSKKKNSTPHPHTPITQLSEKHKANFEAWTKNIVKSCNASEAFGIASDRSNNVESLDAALLIQANNNSLIFQDQEQIAILSDYDVAYGESQSQVEQIENINGHQYAIKASTVRKGRQCEVFLHGEKVFETQLVSSFHIGFYWAPDKTFTPLLVSPKVKALGANGSAELQNSGLNQTLNSMFAANENAVKIISQKLNIAFDDAKKLFKISPTVMMQSALAIADESSASWTSKSSDSLIAHKLFLDGILDGTEKAISIQSVFGLPQFTFGNASNSADIGYVSTSFKWHIKRSSANAFSIEANGLEFQGVKPYNTTSALVCTTSRLHAFLGGDYGPNTIHPAPESLIEPCQSFQLELHDELFASGWMKENIAKVFERVKPAAGFRYNGWEQIVKKLVLDAHAQGQSIKDQFDPHGKTLLFMALDNFFTIVSKEVSQSRGLTTPIASILEMTVQWSLQGFRVNESKVQDILLAVNHAEEPFAASTMNMLGRLANAPFEFDSEIDFAKGMSDEYKNTASAAYNLAKELEYQDFETSVFNVAIQRKVQLQEFADWVEKLSAVKQEISGFQNLGVHRGPLVGLSVKWLRSGEIQPTALKNIYQAFDNLGEDYASSAQRLLADLHQSLQNQLAALDYARHISPEFKQLTRNIAALATSLGATSWLNKVMDSILQNRPSHEIVKSWEESLVAAKSFVARDIERAKDQMGASPEWNRKALVEKAINESWSAADFLRVEDIAKVAAYRNICMRHKDVSSLVDCVGLSLFSRSGKKLLDPIFEGRYGVLAQSFAAHMNSLNDNKWMMMRWNLLDAFFNSSNVVWSHCDRSTFDQKTVLLTKQVKSLAVETDQFKIFELEREIRSNLENCRL